jgi:hypothetical protein
MKGPRKVDRRHGHLTMDSPSNPREGEPVLKIGPERVSFSTPLEKRARARPAAPASTSTLHPGAALISKTTTEAMRITTGCHRTRTATFRVAARYLAKPVTSSGLRIASLIARCLEPPPGHRATATPPRAEYRER